MSASKGLSDDFPSEDPLVRNEHGLAFGPVKQRQNPVGQKHLGWDSWSKAHRRRKAPPHVAKSLPSREALQDAQCTWGRTQHAPASQGYPCKCAQDPLSSSRCRRLLRSTALFFLTSLPFLYATSMASHTRLLSLNLVVAVGVTSLIIWNQE